jgi:hypothetical protein
LLRFSDLSTSFLLSSPLPPRFSTNSFFVFLAFADPVGSNRVLTSRQRLVSSVTCADPSPLPASDSDRDRFFVCATPQIFIR